jgi:hypothetical protein
MLVEYGSGTGSGNGYGTIKRGEDRIDLSIISICHLFHCTTDCGKQGPVNSVIPIHEMKSLSCACTITVYMAVHPWIHCQYTVQDWPKYVIDENRVTIAISWFFNT